MAIIKTISDLLWGMPLIVLILLAGIEVYPMSRTMLNFRG